MNLQGEKQQKHPIMSGSVGPCTLGMGYLRIGYFKDSRDSDET